MIVDQLKNGNKVSDKKFDALFDEATRSRSADHYTTIDVAQAAAAYLADDQPTRVLDIGAGVGKFCIVGSISTPGDFTGVEQYLELSDEGSALIRKYQLQRVRLITADITAIDFTTFEAFYFYNAFHHLISEMGTTAEDRLQYKLNSAYVSAQLQEMPMGTRLATYHSLLKEVPSCYALQSTKFSKNLKLWKKVQ